MVTRLLTVASDGPTGNGQGNGDRNGNGNGLAAGIPRDPARFFLWAVSGTLALLGLFFATLNGLPWPHKAQVEQIGRELARIDKLGDGYAAKGAALDLQLQRMQYEAQQLRDRVDWLEAEIEKLKVYVYPQPSLSRVARPRPPGAPAPRPADALGPPQTTYP